MGDRMFTLVVDVLSRMFDRGVEVGVVEGLQVGTTPGVHVSHLQYADDTMLFLAADMDKFKNVLTLL